MSKQKIFTLYKNQGFSKGFTLLEIAIVLIVIGLLVAGGVGMYGTLIKRSRLLNTRELVKATKEALIGFAIKNNRLPCPDTYDDGNFDGQEDCPYSPSLPFIKKNYKLPYATLGVQRKDAYNKQLYYDVNLALTTTTSGYEFCVAAKNIFYNPSDPSAWPAPPQITLNEGISWSPAAAVVLSSSENMSLDPSINSEDSTKADQRTYENKRVTSNFDDEVAWINIGTILSKKNCQDCASYTIYHWNKLGGVGGIDQKIYVLGGIYNSCTPILRGEAFNVRLGDIVVAYSDNICSELIFYPSSVATPKDQATITYWRAQSLDASEPDDGSWGTVKNDCIVNAKHGIT